MGNDKTCIALIHLISYSTLRIVCESLQLSNKFLIVRPSMFVLDYLCMFR